MKALRIVESKGNYRLYLEDGGGTICLAHFTTPSAMMMFCELSGKGIKLVQEE